LRRKIQAYDDPFDADEGLTHLVPAAGAELHGQIDCVWQPVGTISNPLRYRKGNGDQPNLFCMYAVCDKSTEPLVNDCNFGFGDSFVVFKRW
jgi:hypothetical protein